MKWKVQGPDSDRRGLWYLMPDTRSIDLDVVTYPLSLSHIQNETGVLHKAVIMTQGNNLSD